MMTNPEALFKEYCLARQEKEQAEEHLKRKRGELSYIEGLILEEGLQKIQTEEGSLSVRFENRAQVSDLAFLAAFLKERGLDVNDFLKKPEVKSKDLARVLEGSELPLPISIFKLAIFTLRKKENGNG